MYTIIYIVGIDVYTISIIIPHTCKKKTHQIFTQACVQETFSYMYIISEYKIDVFIQRLATCRTSDCGPSDEGTQYYNKPLYEDTGQGPKNLFPYSC